MKAVFLDRDGVITEMVYNDATGEYEPPHDPRDLKIIDGAIEGLKCLSDVGFLLFLVSNQPDYAKGKTTLEGIASVHEMMDKILLSAKIQFQEYYYCYHHPDGIVPEYSFNCQCRKPKPFFLLKAARDYDISLSDSWMIGDRDSDIECGKAAGVKTILVEYRSSKNNRKKEFYNYKVDSLFDAVRVITKQM